MINATRRGEPLHESVFIIEQVLWGLCMPKREWLTEIVDLAALGRNKMKLVANLGLYFDVVASIQNAYDPSTPLEMRLDSLGSWLRRTPELVSIDKELMVWLAAARCLVRMRAYEQAILCLGQYERLSMTVSSGQTPDGLGLAQDLLHAEWFKTALLPEWSELKESEFSSFREASQGRG